ncbi:MAG: ATP-binding protein [Roseburia sp.]|nr:ATP-binding protein [Roseburia sp.]
MTAYIIAYSIILFIISVSVVALSLLYVRSNKKKADKRIASADVVGESERAFIDVFVGGNGAAFLLTEAETHAPVYIGGDTLGYFGMSAEELAVDILSVKSRVEKKDWRAFRGDYAAWNGEGVLSAEFGYGEGRRASAQIVRRESGGKTYETFLIYDITEQNAAITNLSEELLKARGEAAGKLSFLASMSHEIRTPMNGIMGMMELARMNISSPEKAGDYLKRAGDLSVFLLGMINDILDISKIESGKMLLYNTVFDICAFAEKITNMFKGMVTGKGIHFVVETVGFGSKYFIADEMRLTQVVTNLISNANKFTPVDGTITVTFKQLDTIGGRAQVLIRVRDTGKGIAPENIRKIMKPFEQEEASTSHNYGGTGLGLAICDQIVHLMGGNIVVDSVLGKGTDFSVFLPLEIAGEEPAAVQAAPNAAENASSKFTFGGCRILLAEDNEINAEIAKEILGAEGAEVTHAHDGQEAVDIFLDRPENSFDLILLDIQMPRLNGRDAARAIRASVKGDALIVPIIALSADAFVEDINLSKEAGMDEHVAKPIDFNALRVTAGAVIAEKKTTFGV